MNPEQVDYHRMIMENLDLHAKWIRAEVKEIGIATPDQVKTLKNWAREISNNAQDLEGLILRGEY